MIDNRDPMLQSLFAGAQEELEGDAFTTRLMSKVDRLTRMSRLRRIGVGLILIVCAWFAATPLQEAALAVTRGLYHPLIQLDDGLFAGLISPANTYAGALALILLGLRAAYRTLHSSSH